MKKYKKGDAVLSLCKKCPKCRNGKLIFYVKSGYDVDFDIKMSNQTILCPSCLRKISYSVKKIEEAHEKINKAE